MVELVTRTVFLCTRQGVVGIPLCAERGAGGKYDAVRGRIHRHSVYLCDFSYVLLHLSPNEIKTAKNVVHKKTEQIMKI